MRVASLPPNFPAGTLTDVGLQTIPGVVVTLPEGAHLQTIPGVVVTLPEGAHLSIRETNMHFSS